MSGAAVLFCGCCGECLSTLCSFSNDVRDSAFVASLLRELFSGEKVVDMMAVVDWGSGPAGYSNTTTETNSTTIHTYNGLHSSVTGYDRTITVAPASAPNLRIAFPLTASTNVFVDDLGSTVSVIIGSTGVVRSGCGAQAQIRGDPFASDSSKLNAALAPYTVTIDVDNFTAAPGWTFEVLDTRDEFVVSVDAKAGVKQIDGSNARLVAIVTCTAYATRYIDWRASNDGGSTWTTGTASVGVTEDWTFDCYLTHALSSAAPSTPATMHDSHATSGGTDPATWSTLPTIYFAANDSRKPRLVADDSPWYVRVDYTDQFDVEQSDVFRRDCEDGGDCYTAYAYPLANWPNGLTPIGPGLWSGILGSGQVFWGSPSSGWDTDPMTDPTGITGFAGGTLPTTGPVAVTSQTVGTSDCDDCPDEILATVTTGGAPSLEVNFGAVNTAATSSTYTGPEGDYTGDTQWIAINTEYVLNTAIIPDGTMPFAGYGANSGWVGLKPDGTSRVPAGSLMYECSFGGTYAITLTDNGASQLSFLLASEPAVTSVKLYGGSYGVVVDVAIPSGHTATPHDYTTFVVPRADLLDGSGNLDTIWYMQVYTEEGAAYTGLNIKWAVDPGSHEATLTKVEGECRWTGTDEHGHDMEIDQHNNRWRFRLTVGSTVYTWTVAQGCFPCPPLATWIPDAGNAASLVLS